MPHSPPRHPWFGLIVFLAICFAVAAAGGMATAPNVPGWYAALNKPAWTPPDWLFGPAWTVLYGCMAVAAWLVWRRAGLAGAAAPMALFAVQLFLNGLWSWLFFALHSPGAAMVDIALLWMAIVAATVVFWRRQPAAGLLFLPYMAWVSFACALNLAIWLMN